MRIVTSPEPLALAPHERAVFLAGSIDDGSAADWQAELLAALAGAPGVVLNPRRARWDPAWSSAPDHPELRRQIDWELAAMEAAASIAFYFAPGTQAPVTLLELGLAARTGKAVVCCPPGYWRKGNVDATCAWYRVPCVADLGALAEVVRARLAG